MILSGLPKRTLTTAKGRTVETPFTDGEALAFLENVAATSSFAKDLWDKRAKLSKDQMIWVHILVVEADEKKKKAAAAAAAPKAAPNAPSANNVGDLSKIVAMFTTAKASKLKYPKIRLNVAGQEIRISMAGPKSKYQGAIQITRNLKSATSSFGLNAVNNEWLGRIMPNGDFVEGFVYMKGLVDLLRLFAANPLVIAQEYGKMTGNCCFCLKKLGEGDDKRSVEVGYGPTCAKNYGLVWG